jgi:hypothetical protein
LQNSTGPEGHEAFVKERAKLDDDVRASLDKISSDEYGHGFVNNSSVASSGPAAAGPTAGSTTPAASSVPSTPAPSATAPTGAAAAASKADEESLESMDLNPEKKSLISSEIMKFREKAAEKDRKKNEELAARRGSDSRRFSPAPREEDDYKSRRSSRRDDRDDRREDFREVRASRLKPIESSEMDPLKDRFCHVGLPDTFFIHFFFIGGKAV